MRNCTMRRYIIATALYIVTSLAWSTTWLPLCLPNAEALQVAVRTEDDDEKNESAKFVGKWGFSGVEEWFVEITYKNGDYSFFLNPYYPYLDGEVVEKHVTATEFIYTKKSETDYRPQMRSKGWSYMYDDCDKNADIGYPKTGQYKYYKDVMYSTISISLTGNVPTYGVKKFYTYYYYQGTLTYADTDILHSVTQLVRK